MFWLMIGVSGSTRKFGVGGALTRNDNVVVAWAPSESVTRRPTVL